MLAAVLSILLRSFRPVQHMALPADTPAVERHDWSDVPGEDAGRRMTWLLQEDRRRGFDLSEQPPVRFLEVLWRHANGATQRGHENALHDCDAV